MVVGPVVVRTNGTSRVVSIREAIKLKSCISDASSKKDIEAVVEACTAPTVSVFRISRQYHAIENYRRKNGFFSTTKKLVADRIGDRMFTIQDPVFREICREFGYNPSSLVGAMVKYGFLKTIGKEKHRTAAVNYSHYFVYQMVNPPQH